MLKVSANFFKSTPKPDMSVLLMLKVRVLLKDFDVPNIQYDCSSEGDILVRFIR